MSLQIVDTFSDGFTASWCPPSKDPQCANTWDWTTGELEKRTDSKDDLIINKDEDDCQVVEERQLRCNTQYVLTVWAYSPRGLEGDKVQVSVKTLPCDLGNK